MELHQNSLIDRLEFDNEARPESPVPEKFETGRLELRKIDTDHVDLYTLHSLMHDLEDPEEVFHLCGWERSESLEDTIEFVSSREERWERENRFEYLVIEKESDEYIGTAYMNFSRDLTNCELGYWMRKPFWGNQYSSEFSDAFIHLAFKLIDANYVEVGCLAENEKSLKAMQKYLKRYRGTFTGTNIVDSKAYMETDERTLKHHEFAIRRKDFESGEKGLKTEIPGIKFEETEVQR